LKTLLQGFGTLLALAVSTLAIASSAIPYPVAHELQIETPIPKCGSNYGKTGVLLPTYPRLYQRNDENISRGSQQMIDLLMVVYQQIAWEYPDADPVYMGRINQPGGPKNPYLMHQDGLDGDVGLFTGDGEQHAFQHVDPKHLDAEKTWALIRTFFSTDRVQWILLDQSLINRLADYLREQGTYSEDQIQRIFPPPGTDNPFSMKGIVKHAPGHDNHMHVHLVCE
jgi:murein endopeptidase